MEYIKNMFDIYEHDRERHVHYGISACRDFHNHYSFYIYKNEIESWYRGEDSGARYPEYGDDIIIESYDLTTILDKKISGMTIKDFIDEMLDKWPPSAGRWYTPNELHRLYYYLDNYTDVEKMRIKT